jgi:hypothetical protein
MLGYVDPYPKHIINLTFVHDKVVSIFVEYVLMLKPSKEYCSIDTSTWCDHCGTYILEPISVSKLKDICLQIVKGMLTLLLGISSLYVSRYFWSMGIPSSGSMLVYIDVVSDVNICAPGGTVLIASI